MWEIFGGGKEGGGLDKPTPKSDPNQTHLPRLTLLPHHFPSCPNPGHITRDFPLLDTNSFCSSLQLRGLQLDKVHSFLIELQRFPPFYISSCYSCHNQPAHAAALTMAAFRFLHPSAETGVSTRINATLNLNTWGPPWGKLLLPNSHLHAPSLLFQWELPAESPSHVPPLGSQRTPNKRHTARKYLHRSSAVKACTAY